jgi:hypothetical protein
MQALGRLSERPVLAFRVMEEEEQAEVADVHSGASVAFFWRVPLIVQWRPHLGR